MKRLILIYTLCGLSLATQAQDDHDLETTALHRVTWNKNDTIWQFYAIPINKESKPVKDLVYYWYSPDTILQTEGSYDGHVLDGSFKICYPNKNLMEEGQFSLGLKTGDWRTWYPDGKLRTVAHWKKGRLQGSPERYDLNGNLLPVSVEKDQPHETPPKNR